MEDLREHEFVGLVEFIESDTINKELLPQPVTRVRVIKQYGGNAKPEEILILQPPSSMYCHVPLPIWNGDTKFIIKAYLEKSYSFPMVETIDLHTLSLCEEPIVVIRGERAIGNITKNPYYSGNGWRSFLHTVTFGLVDKFPEPSEPQVTSSQEFSLKRFEKMIQRKVKTTANTG